jgi:hypothetical protein
VNEIKSCISPCQSAKKNMIMGTDALESMNQSVQQGNNV